MQDVIELVKALAWPGVVLFIILKFQLQVRLLLEEMPNAVKRVRSAHGFGLDVQLDKIGDELPRAERSVSTVSLKLPEVPRPMSPEGGRRGDS